MWKTSTHTSHTVGFYLFTMTGFSQMLKYLPSEQMTICVCLWNTKKSPSWGLVGWLVGYMGHTVHWTLPLETESQGICFSVMLCMLWYINDSTNLLYMTLASLMLHEWCTWVTYMTWVTLCNVHVSRLIIVILTKSMIFFPNSNQNTTISQLQ